MRAALGIIAAAFVLASGCARPDWIEQTLVTVDVTGVWQGRYISSSSGDLELTLQQPGGSKVTGQIRLLGGNFRLSGPIEGTVTGDVFRFHESRGQAKSEVQVKGDEMDGSGTAANWGFQQFDKNQSPSAAVDYCRCPNAAAS